jgi:hypothetical protein
MVAIINRALGISDVKEVGDTIVISGASGSALARDIKNLWTTSKIANNMFIKVTWSQVIIPKFFAIELKYILQKLLEEYSLQTPRRLITGILQGLDENTWLRSTIDKPEPWLDRSRFSEVRVKPLPHQMAFFDVYEEQRVRYNLNGYLLAAAPGAGKTLTSIYLALAIKATKVIIVSPKAAIYDVWEKTLNELMVKPQDPYIADRDGAIKPNKKWHIFHYESLDRAEELAKVYGVQGEKVMVVLDESHNINDIKSLRTQRFINVGRYCRSTDILWMSGTPIKAMGAEAIPLIKSIDPLFSAVAEEAFRKIFGKDAKRSLDILSHRLGLVTYKVAKQNVMADKPIETAIPIKMPNGMDYTLDSLGKKMKAFVDERAQYYMDNRGEFLKEFYRITDSYAKTLRSDQDKAAYDLYLKNVTYLSNKKFQSEDVEIAMACNKYEKEKILPTLSSIDKKIFTNVKSIVKYVDLKIRGEALGNILTKERIQCFKDLAHAVDFEQLINSVEKKMVVFSSYVAVVDETRDLLIKQGFSPIVVYGETNHELPRIVKRFGEDPKINPLIATFQSLSTAVPLTMANGVTFLNSPWRSYEREQAIARAHRIGQDQPVFVYDVQLDTGTVPNISTRSIDILQWSKEQVDKIVGVDGSANVSLEWNGLDVPTVADVSDLVEDVAFEPFSDIGDMYATGRLQQGITVSMEK